jgi:hypothetical protein
MAPATSFWVTSACSTKLDAKPIPNSFSFIAAFLSASSAASWAKDRILNKKYQKSNSSRLYNVFDASKAIAQKFEKTFSKRILKKFLRRTRNEHNLKKNCTRTHLESFALVLS